MNKKFWILLLFSGISLSGLAQKTAINTYPEKEYFSAHELFVREKYSAARDKFNNVINNQRIQGDLRTNAQYFRAICAIELLHPDGEYLLRQFIDNHGESPMIRQAYFQMGKYQYSRRQYKDAIVWFDKIGNFTLTGSEQSELNFKKGYSHFMMGDNEKAVAFFAQVGESDKRFGVASKFYFNHISYTKGNYETALQGFMKLSGDKNFGSAIPYYITQIYYLQGKYESVIEYGAPMLKSGDPKKSGEINRLIGDSYYRLGKFKESIPYLEAYGKTTGKSSREESYQLAYAYYKSASYTKAIKLFEYVANSVDSLSQSAHYHLADSYIKSGNKTAARTAFREASKINIDRGIKEDALFNYAKLSYELSINPYNEAIGAFEEYIKEYPSSPRLTEAYDLLISAFVTSKNYKDALVSMEKTPLNTEKMKESYQQIAFNRAVELYSDLSYQGAIIHFNKSLKYPIDKVLEANAQYWKAESYSRLKEWDTAIDHYKTFLFMPGAARNEKFNTANYDLGYAYYKKSDYTWAVQWFRKFISVPDATNRVMLADAYLRTGDSYFMMREYNTAIEYYDKAMSIKSLEPDYAMLQVAMCYGLTSRYESKVSYLTTLTDTYKNSKYAAEAIFETGETQYLFLNNTQGAFINFTKLVDNYPNSIHVKKSLLNIGMIHFNREEDEKALVMFKKVIELYPGTVEAREALIKIQKIYVENGEVNKFEDYVRGQKFPDISMGTLDTASYDASEKKFMKGDYATASRDFTNYLAKFPKGSFVLNANFYKAECDYIQKEYDKALSGYNFVIAKPRSIFTEKSLVRSASLYMMKDNCNDAMLRFTMLEEIAEVPSNLIDSRIGLMRCHYKLMNIEDALKYANKIVNSEKIAPEIAHEAHLIVAKSALLQNNYPLALAEFNNIVKLSKGAVGAEAKYNIAYVQFLMENNTESEKTIFELIKDYPSSENWVAKGFLLLADNYIKKNDLYQAKVTLQNLIDNYDGEDIINIAKEKLNKIKREESNSKNTKKDEEMIIDFEEKK